MCVNNSGIFDYPRHNYFIYVETLSARYAFDIGLLSSYGYNFKVPTIDYLVKFYGVFIRDGVRGGIDGAFYCRWKYNGSDFDEEITSSINLGRWLQIKRVMRLYNNKDVPKRGDTNYNPSYKLDLIYNHIVHNINSITKWATLAYVRFSCDADC